MKLEKLNGSKFEAFKENELKDLFAIVGGKCVNTYGNNPNANLPSDSLTDAKTWDHIWTDPGGGRPWAADYSTDICPVGTSEGQGAAKFFLVGEMGNGPITFLCEDAIDVTELPGNGM